MNEEVGRCNWMWGYQPANSLLTNVKDAYIFPAMSKHVTAEQGISNGSKVLKEEELWLTIKLAWNNKLPEETIARSYAGHHQIVNAIVERNGGDHFVRGKNGLTFGIRKHCVPYYLGEATTPAGVEMITERVHNGKSVIERSGLKCSNPDVNDVAIGDFLDNSEFIWLHDNEPLDCSK